MADEKQKVKGNKAKARQGNREGKKRKRARYVAEGRMEKNRKRRMLRTLRAQPTNEPLRSRIRELYGRVV